MKQMEFPREEHSNWFSRAKWLALKIYIKTTLYRLNSLYVEISHTRIAHICICIHTIRKQALGLKDRGEGCMRGLEGRKGARET